MGQDILPREDALFNTGHWVESKVIEKRMKTSVVEGGSEKLLRRKEERKWIELAHVYLGGTPILSVLYFPVLSVYIRIPD